MGGRVKNGRTTLARTVDSPYFQTDKTRGVHFVKYCKVSLKKEERPSLTGEFSTNFTSTFSRVLWEAGTGGDGSGVVLE